MIHRHTAEALEFLDVHAEGLIRRLTEQQLAAEPQLERRFGSSARQRCTEDNRFHLHYLTAAILAENTAVFSDYCGWVKVVLGKRGISADHLERNLRSLREAILSSAPDGVADLVCGYLDVALQRLPGYPDEPSPAQATAADPMVREYVERVLALDAEGAARLIESRATDAAAATRLYVEVLAPAQREIGRLWQIAGISVAVEHFATATTERILHRLSRKWAPAAARNVRLIGLCPEGERHCVGLLMVCDLARLNGWRADFVGASTPQEAAIALVQRERPQVVAVSLTTLLSLQSTRSLIARLNEAAPQAVVLVGGYALSLIPDMWKRLGADAYAADAIAALATLEDILRNNPAEARRRRQGAG